MKILYLSSNSPNMGPLQIEAEINRFRQALDAYDTGGLIDLRTYPSVDVADLPAIISRINPEVIHFAAHGDVAGLYLAHSDRGTVELSGDQLAILLRALSVTPRLVVLNACNSAETAKRVANAAEFAIGIDAPISNVGARTMAATLYQQLARGATLASAFEASATLLQVIDLGTANAKLYPADGMALARKTVLSEPFRIVACFPDVEEFIEDGSDKDFKLDAESPCVQFGVAGAPPDACQLQFFTDDDSIQPDDDNDLETARSWLVEARPVRGEIWIESWFAYYGDLHWYASVVTGTKRIYSASAAMCDALERYYFTEAWRGELPSALETQIRSAIQTLRQNDGARRSRTPTKKSGGKTKTSREKAK